MSPSHGAAAINTHPGEEEFEKDDRVSQNTLHDSEEVAPDTEKQAPTEPAAQSSPWGTADSPPPDGGFAAWSVVLGAWCIGTFQTYYETTLLSGYSTSTIAWIPSLEVFFMFFMGPIVGTLSDRLGARVVIIAGSILHVFGLMMTSISTEYYQVLLSQG
ncbi:hypothetical protein AbraIFM66950_007278, partial [Aspergillus brasiliensis]